MPVKSTSRSILWLSCCSLMALLFCHSTKAENPPLVSWAIVDLDEDDNAGTLTVSFCKSELFKYQYGQQYALPHIWPVRSPSGKLLTQQDPDPYPHHRSLWIADKIQVGKQSPIDFYHVQRNYKKKDDPKSGFRHFIRHKQFTKQKPNIGQAVIASELEWIANESTPVVQETRLLKVFAFRGGEYLIDLSWELKPTSKEVTFVSDWVHYAWPYVRVHPQFSGERGGTIQDDQGRRGQAGTNEKYAKWIDYSNTVDGVTEGLAIFIHPEDGQRRKWLTRDYGTFGPRRPDAQSGKPIKLQPGHALTGRAGLLIHRGDVETGRVAERYQQYIEGKL